MIRLFMAAVVLSAAAIDTAAQTVQPTPQPPPAQRPATQPPPTQPPTTQPRPPVRRATPAPPKTTSVRIGVKDADGNNLADVRLVLSGAGSGEFTTGAAGTAVLPNIADGAYRIRAEHNGFITLEREFTVKGGAWNPIDIVLNPAPPPPPPPRAPEPAPKAAAPPAAGPPVMLSIPDFLDKNFIGREPMKESVLACKPFETVRLLQMREAVATHVHDRFDEIIYVVAGEGTVRIGDQATPLRAGGLVVVPTGSGHSFERQGRNPLIVLSTLSGSACETKSTQ